MTLSCMGKELPKEKQFGVRVCRERKCVELQKDPKYPDSPEFCQVIGGMPGAMPQCIKEAPPDKFIRRMSGQLNVKYPSPHPGVRNCPKECPYKLEKGTICAFTGEVCKAWGVCPCNVLGNEDQENYLKQVLEPTVQIFQKTEPAEILRTCHRRQCPDGMSRCNGGTDCPLIRVPFKDLKACPLWRIPAKLLQVPVEQPPTYLPEIIEQKSPVVVRDSYKPAPEKKTRTKKERPDPICEACRERMKGNVPAHACAWCKEEQQQKGRRAWVTDIKLGSVLLGDMEEEGKRVPDQSVDAIFTDPPYVKELWENAYSELAMLAARVLKPGGFLFTYAPQAHLAEIMDLLRYSTPMDEGLSFFWIIQSLNTGQVAKDHKHNALCLHKPILVFQNGSDVKGARRCFADVVRGLKQKRFPPWQQSVHDVLGIIDRFMVPGEILLDPFAGWGTSLIAANLLGMEWVGFEIEPDRQRTATERLQQQPITLGAFGIEAEDAPEQREPAEHKDASKQASIEKKSASKKSKTQEEPE